MRVGSGFRVGDIELRSDVVTKESIEALSQAARGAGLQEGVEEVAEVLDSWKEAGQLSTDDYDTIDDFRRAAGRQWRQLTDQFWDRKREGASWDDLKPLEQEMGKVGNYLHLNNQLRTELREATARTAVEAAAGASLAGPVGVISLYAAYANGSRWDKSADEATAELLKTYGDYLSGDSRMITEGNQVEQIHRESLWHSMTGVLEEAKQSAAAGEETELTQQYYELTSPRILGASAAAVEEGAKLRVNIDPGRLSYPDKDDEGSYFEVDDIPHKMRTAIQLLSLDGNVGVSIFAVKKLLDDPEDLMHRKILRSGDWVTASGMNANAGSGENVDAGYRLKGPAAKRLIENVRRDVKDSLGAGIGEIWGEDHFEGFREGRLKMGKRGLAAVLDVLAGPSSPDTPLPRPSNRSDFAKMAKRAGVKLDDLFLKEDGMKDVLAGHQAELSPVGKEKLIEVIERAVTLTQAPDNVEKAADIDLPSGRKVGETRVDIADLPAERETLMLEAISTAEKFVYLPGFVVTRAVAAAIVARRNELKAQGKELDVKVLADPGIYPGGDTPNSWGVKFLEDHGITPRWALLTRSGWHDRKIHAKQLITDKGEMTGSTNFSKKGMRENWETSTFVHFNENDPDSLANRDRSVDQFLDLWKNNTFEFSSLDLSAYYNRYKPQEGRDYFVEDSRNYAIRKTIGWIEDYEEQSAQFMSKLARRPDIAAKVGELKEAGYSEGDSILMGVVDGIGERAYYEGLSKLPAYAEMHEMKTKVAEWKERYG